jgi:16S rRNA processing protein RimM
MEQADQDWVIIGRVVKARGLKGELKIQLTTDFPERFSAGKEVLLKKKS